MICLFLFLAPVFGAELAVAEYMPLRYTITSQVFDPATGEWADDRTAHSDVDFFLSEWAGEFGASLWFNMLDPMFPLDAVKVSAVFETDDMRVVEYWFYDAMTQSYVLDLSGGSPEVMGAYTLSDEYGEPASIAAPVMRLGAGTSDPPMPGETFEQTVMTDWTDGDDVFFNGDDFSDGGSFGDGYPGDGYADAEYSDDGYFSHDDYFENSNPIGGYDDLVDELPVAVAAQFASLSVNPEDEMSRYDARGSNYTKVLPGGAEFAFVFNDPGQVIRRNEDDVIILLFEHPSGQPCVLTNESGLWHYSQLDGEDMFGYVLLSGIEYLTADQREEYIKSVQRTQLPDHETDVLRVNAVGAGLVTVPNGSQIMPLAQGQIVTYAPDAYVPPYRSDSSGDLWVYVNVEDADGIVTASGYIRMGSAVFLTRAELQALSTGTEAMPADRVSDYARVGLDGADLMASMGGGNRLETLPAGKVVRYLYDNVVDGVRWLNVEVLPSGRMGHVRLSDITFMTEQQESAYHAEMTVSNQESDYARVNANNTPIVDIHTGVTVATKSFNDVVLYQKSHPEAIELNADGKALLRVELPNNQSGYIAKSALSFMTAAQQEAYLQEINKTDPPPKATLQPGTSRYATVNTNSVNIRKSPSTSANVFPNQARLGDVMLVTDQMTVDGALWYHVRLSNGEEGYVMANLLDLMTDEEDLAYAATHPTPAPPTPTPIVTPSPAPTPVSTPPLHTFSGFARVSRLAPMLSWPNVGATFRGELKAGEVVQVVTQQYADDNKTLFSYVYYNGYYVWVEASYLAAMTPTEINDYFQSRQTPPPPTASPIQTNQPSGYGLVLDNNVNFRTSASTNAEVITRLSKNTIVRILGETVSGGYVWYRCESNGRTGYLRGDYVTPLTISQYLSVVSSPSYSQGGNIITPTAPANQGGINANTWSTPNPNATSGISFVTIPPLGPTPTADVADPSATPTTDPSASPTAGEETPEPSATPLFPPVEESPFFPEERTGGFSPRGFLWTILGILVIGGGAGYAYYVYNKERVKQSRATAQNAPQARPGPGGQPAVRRPVPPGSPQQSGGVPRVAGVTGSVTGQRPQQPGASGQTGRPGMPGQPGPQARPGQQQLRPNPYARPQQSPGVPPDQPPIQDVRSGMPRAHVDGRPLSVQPNPYAKPPQTSGGLSPAGGIVTDPLEDSVPAGTIPVAPPLNIDESKPGPEGDEPRRRRRRSEQQPRTETETLKDE
ncbi:MAG: SH3 domain-containing protein [Clostridia bacterium]|nr:SH3 domain-containing protein [Clostridia bacterium]